MYQGISHIADELENNLTAHRSQDVTEERVSDYLVEYHTSRFLGMNCWFSGSELEKTRNGLELMAKSLQGKIKNFNGSEVAEVAIQRLMNSLKDREAQMTVLEAFHLASLDAYETFTGKAYQTGAKNKGTTQTAVSMEAAALAAKYAKPEPKVAPKGRPATYTDDKGVAWFWDDATGQYVLSAI